MTAASDYLLMRLEAPLMSFGSPMVDQIGPTRQFPGQAQVAGLLANALGYEHREPDRIETLQDRLRLACLLVRPGALLRDYQTVDLGRAHLSGTGWTTRERLEKRDGASSEATHIRQRWHVADAAVVVALLLDPRSEQPTVRNLAEALERPARPLFIGRRPCLPTQPIRLGAPFQAETPEAALFEALDRSGLAMRARGQCEIDARLRTFPADETFETERLFDGRDWRNQIHDRTRDVHRFHVSTSAGIAS